MYSAVWSMKHSETCSRKIPANGTVNCEVPSDSEWVRRRLEVGARGEGHSVNPKIYIWHWRESKGEKPGTENVILLIDSVFPYKAEVCLSEAGVCSLVITQFTYSMASSLRNDSTISEVRLRHKPGDMVAATTHGLDPLSHSPQHQQLWPQSQVLTDGIRRATTPPLHFSWLCYSLWDPERKVRGIIGQTTYSLPRMSVCKVGHVNL